jgi:folylpolyglutamate synthase
MPAYFAFLTIMALHVFQKEQTDVTILEVGIGGQYDSTNFVRKPVSSKFK